ncbi:unnamed protein product [Caenorhabditis auriculariae]|uniref:RNA-directed DNA polymerase n=1 Tax=Caenorhabditis auriculariae TaxID=2777116 RepID=A0A8S1HXM4_9PELO|nr:unnamed protein product [Caenorhabditis auriculariae]
MHFEGRWNDENPSEIISVLEQTSGKTLSEKVKKLVSKFTDVFVQDDKDLTQTPVFTHDIELLDDRPIRQKTRHIPFGLRNEFRKTLDEMLSKGVAEPSSSPYASPVVLVKKKDGTIRVCIDYREINKVIKQDSYPLPKMDSIVQDLGGNRFFSTLDLLAGYWQIPLTEKAKEVTAFTTSEGLFQFTVLPFGLATSPPTFQRMMEIVLKDLIRDGGVHCYIDDVLVASKTEEEHLELLEKVLDAFRRAGLSLKASKCKIMQQQVKFLGQIIDSNGVSTDPEKIAAVKDFPQPSKRDELRSFLGLCSFYRKFIFKFGTICKPLYELISEKVKFEWTTETLAAFDHIKQELIKAPVLAQPDIEGAINGSKPFIIYTDASRKGIGAVLCQKGIDEFLHPIFFSSKGLSAAEVRYGITELEALGVIHAVRKFHQFIYGIGATVRTDHQPLLCFFKRGELSPKVMRWALDVQRYQINLEYVKGKANVVADALSRGPTQILEIDPNDQDYVVAAVKLELDRTEDEQWLAELREDQDWTEAVAAVEQANDSFSLKLPGIEKDLTINHLGAVRKALQVKDRRGLIVTSFPTSENAAEEQKLGAPHGFFGLAPQQPARDQARSAQEIEGFFKKLACFCDENAFPRLSISLHR